MTTSGKIMLRIAACIASCIIAYSAVADDQLLFRPDGFGVGDPNPFFENGQYSIFYLRNTGRHPIWMTKTKDGALFSSPIEAIHNNDDTTSIDNWTGSGSTVRAQNGIYYFFYTAHNPNFSPEERVVWASAQSVDGPWTKHKLNPVTASNGYSFKDFRDPYVFWNKEDRKWWMLLCTQWNEKPAVGLYTSDDLSNWKAERPLFIPTQGGNPEVPELFQLGKRWYLLYSSQSEPRVVHYLTATSPRGPFVPTAVPTLDGTDFYAGKSAGTEVERLLFGWVPRRQLGKDRFEKTWGGDLVVHRLTVGHDGSLDVSLPSAIEAKFSKEREIVEDNVVIPSNSLSLFSGTITIPTPVFGFQFIDKNSLEQAKIIIDTENKKILFEVKNDDNSDNKIDLRKLEYPLSVRLITDPDSGVGVLYIGNGQSISFRFYGIRRTTLKKIGHFHNLSIRTSK